MTFRERSGRREGMKKRKDPAAVALGRKGGKKGGPARAAKMTPEERQESARKAVQARWKKAKETKGGQVMTLREELREGAKRLAQPVDLKALISQGLMKKEGSRYRVWNIHELPRHVCDHIVETATTKGVPGVLVKFKLTSQAQLKKLAEMAQI